LTTTHHPVIGGHVRPTDGGQHDFMIAPQGDHLALLAKFDKLVDHAAGVGASIDVITQQNQGVIAGRLDSFQDRPERLAAPVDVADRNRASRWVH
jgi:hypothetical protein